MGMFVWLLHSAAAAKFILLFNRYREVKFINFNGTLQWACLFGFSTVLLRNSTVSTVFCFCSRRQQQPNIEISGYKNPEPYPNVIMPIAIKYHLQEPTSFSLFLHLLTLLYFFNALLFQRSK